MRYLIALILLCATTSANADGYMLKAGRFTDGKVTVLTLTPEQKQLIGYYRRCFNNRYNETTPYFFRLTPGQSKQVLKEAGLCPKRFAICDSYNGDKGIECEYNVINRFGVWKIEIPHKLLISERQLRNWEKNVIGWQPSPFDRRLPANRETLKCP